MQNKLKSLLPVLKEKKRYVVFSQVGGTTLPQSLHEIVSRMKSILGMFESASAGIMAVEYKNGFGIVKVNNLYADKVKAAMLMITSVGGQKAIVSSIGVSGTINKARSKFTQA